MGPRIVGMAGEQGAASVPAKRKSFHEGKPQKARIRTKLRKRETRDGPTTEQVLDEDVTALMRELGVTDDDIKHVAPLLEELEVQITRLSSTGEGLGRSRKHPSEVFVVPFAIPGDVVLARPYKRVDQPSLLTLTDFVSVVEASPDRDDGRIRCKYFQQCSGCQYQMMSYEKQLEHKRLVVRRAFENFSGLPAQLVPEIGHVRGSPLQYGFRTKLTPHYDAPPGGKRHKGRDNGARHQVMPAIGFMRKGRRTTLDIEECPIASDIVNLGMERERRRVADELHTKVRGATLLLRESTRRVPETELEPGTTVPSTDKATGTIYERGIEGYALAKKCITTDHATATEYIGDFKFENSAGCFFQNNNAILPSFTGYIREQLAGGQYKNLIDAYCGSGLFSITLGSLFERTIGIDIDARSVQAAEQNLRVNAARVPGAATRYASHGVHLIKSGEPLDAAHGLTKTPYVNSFSKGVGFIAADAAQLFTAVEEFDAAETAVILDPPRKGCDAVFLRQLLDFAPQRIVYVSCNVHTQARDIGWLLRGGEAGGTDDAVERPTYRIDSLIGFDFFPQTSHVEGVAVLTKVDVAEQASTSEVMPASADTV